jgi:uncharacterized DUF497 family protein
MLGFDLSSPAGFEWDEEKSRANLVKHGIGFEDASQIFYGPIVVKVSNRNNEERWENQRSNRHGDFYTSRQFDPDHFGTTSETR